MPPSLPPGTGTFRECEGVLVRLSAQRVLDVSRNPRGIPALGLALGVCETCVRSWRLIFLFPWCISCEGSFDVCGCAKTQTEGVTGERLTYAGEIKGLILCMMTM